MSVTSLHLIIHGRVQGVGYRAWTVSRARSLGLHGWVRNRRDGTVEAVISGDAASIETMLADCRDGPPVARVDEIAAAPWIEPVAEGFASRETV